MIPLEVFNQTFLVEALLPSDDLKFYTDGSLFVSRAGSGVFFAGT
jgi:hypothetical protein